MSMRNELGRAGESLAARFLEAKGWRIVGRNVRCGRSGEIDIVAARNGVLAFVEVKTRRTARYGTPGEAVTRRKQLRIRAMARAYLASVRPGADAVRFDVIEVRTGGPRPSVTHLEGVF
jgi:putative endonuclease